MPSHSWAILFLQQFARRSSLLLFCCVFGVRYSFVYTFGLLSLLEDLLNGFSFNLGSGLLRNFFIVVVMVVVDDRDIAVVKRHYAALRTSHRQVGRFHIDLG
jgi:hypothetical protein